MSARLSACDSLQVVLHYRQGSAVVDSAFSGNRGTMVRLRTLAADSVAIETVDIVSSASPEGTSSFNRVLSEYRTSAAIEMLSRVFGSRLPKVTSSSIGVDWERFNATIDRADVDEIYPELRASRITIIYRPFDHTGRKGGASVNIMGGKCDLHPEAEPRQLSLPVISPESLDGLRPIAIGVRTVERFTPRFAVSTNILIDALAIPNLSLWMMFGSRWALVLTGMDAWWSRSDRGRYWRAQGGTLTLQRYFSDSYLSGHHTGVYVHLYRYDFSTGSSGQLSGGSGASFGDHPSWGVGVNYGYSFAISERMRLDLSAGIGYTTGRYMTYRRTDGHSEWQSTRMRRYFGPTMAEVSLVWIIGKGGSL